MEPSGADDRFQFIHALRGIAALLVVSYHLCGMWLSQIHESSALQNLLTYFFIGPFNLYQDGGHLGVIIFFLISGFIITHVSLRESRSIFVIKRVLRIFPTVIVAVLLSFVLIKLSFVLFHQNVSHVNNQGGKLHWFLALFLLDGWLYQHTPVILPVTWTLATELTFYAFILVFMRRGLARPLYTQWQFTLAMVGLLAVLYIPFDGAFINNDSAYLVYLPFLVLGRLIYLTYKKHIGLRDAVFNGAALMFIFYTFTNYRFDTNSWIFMTPAGDHMPASTYILAIIIFLGALRLSPKKISAPLSFLGDISYSLYLLHIPVGFCVLYVLHREHVSNSLTTLAAIAVAIGVAYLSNRFVEKPSQRLARVVAPAIQKYTARATKWLEPIRADWPSRALQAIRARSQ